MTTPDHPDRHTPGTNEVGTVTPRRVTSKAMHTMQQRCAELLSYSDQYGGFNVPRTGPRRELGQWLDKLKETFMRRPHGHRIEWLRQNAPEVHAHLRDWAQRVAAASTIGQVPFWIAASWVFDILVSSQAAPDLNSSDPRVHAAARWLRRSPDSAPGRLASEPKNQELARRLQSLARDLGSADQDRRGAARQQLRHWRLNRIYSDLVYLANIDNSWMSPELHRSFTELLSRRERFWPSWDDWERRLGNKPD